MGPPRNDFIWSEKADPSIARRAEMLKKYPHIRKLFGIEPATKYIVLGLVTLQLGLAFTFRSTDSVKSWPFWLCAYVFGGTATQALFLGIHELSHGLGFKSIRHNSLFAILVANLPIPVPYAASFRPYHMDHHKYQGLDGVDTDLPTELEARLLDSTLGKAFFATFQVLFYALRPVIVNAKPFTTNHILNVVSAIGFQVLLWYTLGFGPLIYLLVSTLFAGSGLHPCAAHFISEHYVFTGDTETYSYYGMLNALCFNVGYHNEHHDFPNISWSKLPALRTIAPEYYDTIPQHKSWPMVTWNFIFDPSVGVWSRVKRREGAVANLAN